MQSESRVRPGALDENTQQELIQQIGRVLVQALPPGWQEVGVEYRAVGAHSELTAQLTAPNGTLIPWAPPEETAPMFDRLRIGMHQPDRGTWISALYRLQRPGSYSVDFNGDHEPAWHTPPPTAEFAAELRTMPRAGENIPAWMAERAGLSAPSGSAAQDGNPRPAEAFDGAGEAGRQAIDNPPA
ncbi:hypothetical protein DFQ14_12314 [Halopolyspora algeriensis]|uniref:Type III secretion system (T3SS) SseB-like protein n=2 Tax=Halopolyspora algeriensis TaxID=1500506 RepID=A0A368VB22_9ACTN|nr:hypothetical protein [Halopolyspora algeriensis]RCW38447.1 hypothetical protein DFQ14_12314 [Halopolyspora algeriensis]TQM55762.1 hypothetical protein FHU43_0538 [Halopolyspora algeriensis]